jgi:N-acetylneuraminic acid mutarotase
MRWHAIVAVVSIIALAGCLEDASTKEAQAAKARAAQKPVIGGPGSLGVPELPPAPKWQALADAAYPRAEHCVTNIGPKFFIVAGYIVPTPVSAPGPAGSLPVAIPTATVEIYDATTDSWTAGTDYPSAVNHCMAATVGDTAYVIAGAQSYKTKDGMSWTAIPAPPNSHGATGVSEEIGGLIYTTAGSGSGSDFVDVYDPVANTWTTIPDSMIPTRRNHMGGAALNGKLYAVGGDVQGHSVNTGANQEFDPLTATWTNKTDLPVVRGSLQAFAWFGHMVVMGGQNGATNVPSFKEVHAYNPITDTWVELPSMSNPRHGFAGGVWEDKLYVFGGAPQQGVSAFPNTDVLVPG